MNDHETATILLALRLLQLSYNEQTRSYNLPPQLEPYQQEDEILTPDEIDDLCDDINSDSLELLTTGWLYDGV